MAGAANPPTCRSPLDRQVAVVTGGGRGIGRAIALALGRAGASVAVIARTRSEIEETASLLAAQGVAALAVPADVTDRKSVESAFEQVTDMLGPVDLLVNNAGTNRVFGPLWAVDPDDWWGDVVVNLRGPLLCSRAVLPSMVARGCGRIVNIGSGSAGRPGRFNSAYATSKAALVRLTDSLAAETEGTGIAVFVLGPGAVDTALTRHLRGSSDAQRWIGDVVAALQYAPASVAAEAVVLIGAGLADSLSGRWIDAADGIRALALRSSEISRLDLYQLRRITK